MGEQTPNDSICHHSFAKASVGRQVHKVCQNLHGHVLPLSAFSSHYKNPSRHPPTCLTVVISEELVQRRSLNLLLQPQVQTVAGVARCRNHWFVFFSSSVARLMMDMTTIALTMMEPLISAAMNEMLPWRQKTATIPAWQCQMRTEHANGLGQDCG